MDYLLKSRKTWAFHSEDVGTKGFLKRIDFDMHYNIDSSGLSDDAKHVKPNFTSLKYFGNCKNVFHCSFWAS